MSDGAFGFGLMLVIATVLCLVMVQNAAIYAGEIKRCEYLCRNNGGIEKIYWDSDCRCIDGAFFSTESTKWEPEKEGNK